MFYSVAFSYVVFRYIYIYTHNCLEGVVFRRITGVVAYFKAKLGHGSRSKLLESSSLLFINYPIGFSFWDI